MSIDCTQGISNRRTRRRPTRTSAGVNWTSAGVVAVVLGLLVLPACASSGPAAASPEPVAGGGLDPNPPSPDPRVGLAPGLLDAGEAIWNLEVLSSTRPPEDFIGETNSDLAFLGDYAIQGNYNGFLVWDISNPADPELVEDYLCPASQSDVSVYENLLFVSGEGLGGRVDCGTQGVDTAVSDVRLRGIRIFDISDIRNPEYIANVQTCRGSHTHSLLVDPDDSENVYVYVSGSAPVRPAEELPGCLGGLPGENPETALFRIEVVQVPLDAPEEAAIVSSPRIFDDLTAPEQHGLSPADLEQIEEARAEGAFVIEMRGQPQVLSDREADRLLEQVVAARGGSGAPTAADSTTLRNALPMMVAQTEAQQGGDDVGPTQCHDITLYPAIGLGGGACEGYGFLLDIEEPTNPIRLDAVADSNFAYWHSATFDNAGEKVLFTDEWGGGGQPKCRESDPPEWGANAIFSIEDREMRFRSYYKLPAPQTDVENCVAHNGSLIPVPGRDIMAQAWYQGGISVFDWTNPDNAVEIAFFDRGPVDPDRVQSGGPWSVYWYNGVLVSSEIARGLDILALTPNPLLTENEIAAAESVRLDYFNAQNQVQFEWPATFALARAYVDQLVRSGGLGASRIASVRAALADAEAGSGSARADALSALAEDLEGEVSGSVDAAKVELLVDAVRRLADEA